MKKSISLLLLATMIIAVSCSKSKSEPEPPAWTPEGYWVGHYTTGGFTNPDNYSILLTANGDARIYDMGNKSDTTELSPFSKVSGKWSLSNQTMQVSYKSGTKKVVASATLQAGQTEMAGIWTMDEEPKGNFYLSK